MKKIFIEHIEERKPHHKVSWTMWPLVFPSYWDSLWYNLLCLFLKKKLLCYNMVTPHKKQYANRRRIFVLHNIIAVLLAESLITELISVGPHHKDLPTSATQSCSVPTSLVLKRDRIDSCLFDTKIALWSSNSLKTMPHLSITGTWTWIWGRTQ